MAITSSSEISAASGADARALSSAPNARLTLIRHAPVVGDGRVYGRRDLAARLPSAADLAALREKIGPVDWVMASPAQRCQATAKALWPDADIAMDARFLEQDLGSWEGRPYAELPDLGPLSLAELAAHCPPCGESFSQMAARVIAGLAELRGRGALVAHAGTIRAALGFAAGSVAAGLRFEIAPLSLTRLSLLPEGAVIHEVNRCL